MYQSSYLSVLFFIFYLSLLDFGVHAQSAFHANAHAGLAGTQVQGDGLGGFDKPGVMFGLGVSTDFNEKWGLGFELNYVQKGSKRNPDPENNDYNEYKMALGYIQIPILLSYNFHEKFAVKAGPGIGVLIHNKESDYNGEITNTPEFKTMEFSGIVGVEYKFISNFYIEARFDQSFLPIRSKGGYAGNFLRGKQFNTVLGLYIGKRF